jgi:hypothetical protein
MIIHFYSKNKKWCSLMQSTFENYMNKQSPTSPFHIIIENTLLQTLNKNNSLFVSPTNSLLRMEGGIDRIMNLEIFPKINKSFVKLAKKIAIVDTNVNKYILPIGSSLFIEVPKDKSGLIVTPTMFNSSNISHTQNVYISFISILSILTKINQFKENNCEKKFERIYITSHGCGNGGMSINESVKQFYQAFQDFLNGDLPNQIKYINSGCVPEHMFILFEYKEKEKKENIDENGIKTIKISNNYQIEDK